MKHKTCCAKTARPKKNGFLEGLIYGLLPHSGCIAFLVLSVIGATAASALFRPLLASAYFFYGLIVLSIALATLSAFVYLRRNSSLSLKGIAESRNYLFTLYASTIGVNVLMFTVIFPAAANIGSTPIVQSFDRRNITLTVDIPCSGHAPLIIQELETIEGVTNIYFTAPNRFNVQYDPNLTEVSDILNLQIFYTYRARVLDNL